jgi:hypothetical protein
MGEFAPSIEAAKQVLGASTPVEVRQHPTGPEGAQVSLDEVAARIRKGRIDPRVRAWAIRAIKEGGEPRSTRGQAQAILDALRKATTYVQDPVNAEFMQAAHETLCLDDKGLCFKGGDCDDLVIAYGSATSSIGIPTQVVGQSFKLNGVPTHVIAAVQDTKDGEWYRVDPSSKFDVGSYFPATKEIWIDPLENGTPQGLGGEFVGVGRSPHGGEFVSVGQVPEIFGNDVQESLAPYFWNRGYSLGAGPIGVGDYTEAERAAIFDSATQSLQSALYKLQQSLIDLKTSKDQANSTRAALNPNQPFDPEPAFAINDVSDFLAGGKWTLSMSNVCDRLIDLGSELVHMGQQALTGARRILVDQSTKEAYIESRNEDPWRLHVVVRTATDSVVAFLEKPSAISPALLAAATAALAPFSPAIPLAMVAVPYIDGFVYLFSYANEKIDIQRIIGGFSSKSGQALSPQEVQAQMQRAEAQSNVQGVGLAPLAVVVIVAAVALATAAVAIGTYYTISKLCDTATATAKEATTQAILQLVASGKMTPDQAKNILQTVSDNRVAETKAEEEKNKADPFANAMGTLGKMVTWLVIGGVVVTGVVIGAPLIKEGVSELTAWSRERRERIKAERDRSSLPPVPVEHPAPAIGPTGTLPGLAPVAAEQFFTNPRRRPRRRRRH